MSLCVCKSHPDEAIHYWVGLIFRIRATEMSGKEIFSCHTKTLVQSIRLDARFCFYSLKVFHGELRCIEVIIMSDWISESENFLWMKKQRVFFLFDFKITVPFLSILSLAFYYWKFWKFCFRMVLYQPYYDKATPSVSVVDDIHLAFVSELWKLVRYRQKE